MICSWYLNVQEYEEIIDVLTAGKIELEWLAIHKVSHDDAESVFRLFDERKTEKAALVL